MNYCIYRLYISELQFQALAYIGHSFNLKLSVVKLSVVNSVFISKFQHRIQGEKSMQY